MEKYITLMIFMRFQPVRNFLSYFEKPRVTSREMCCPGALLGLRLGLYDELPTQVINCAPPK